MGHEREKRFFFFLFWVRFFLPFGWPLKPPFLSKSIFDAGFGTLGPLPFCPSQPRLLPTKTCDFYPSLNKTPGIFSLGLFCLVFVCLGVTSCKTASRPREKSVLRIERMVATSADGGIASSHTNWSGQKSHETEDPRLTALE